MPNFVNLREGIDPGVRNWLVLFGLMLFVSCGTAFAGKDRSAGIEGHNEDVVQFVDLLWVKQDKTPDDAVRYFREVLPPILARHGGKVLHVYRVEAALRGDMQPAITASLTFPSMQALESMFKDPEYQKIIPERDAIFDFSQQSLLRVTAM